MFYINRKIIFQNNVIFVMPFPLCDKRMNRLIFSEIKLLTILRKGSGTEHIHRNVMPVC